MKIKHLLILSLSLIFFSCGKSELSPSEYIDWNDNPDNGLIKEFTQGSTVLTCQYTSPEYVSLKQSNSENIDQNQVEENIAGISEMQHFKFKFENTESNNFMRDNYTTAEEFNTKSMYLSYDIRYDLSLVSKGDTSMCVLNHHERTYGNTPYETLLISFPKTNNETSDLELIFEDRVFGLGRVKFFFSAGDLEYMPKLVF